MNGPEARKAHGWAKWAMATRRDRRTEASATFWYCHIGLYARQLLRMRWRFGSAQFSELGFDDFRQFPHVGTPGNLWPHDGHNLAHVFGRRGA